MTPPTHGPGVVNGHTRNSPYGYTPSAPANITFLAVFAYFQVIRRLIPRILTFGHAFLGIKYRTWFFSGMFILGGIGIAFVRQILTVRGNNWVRWTGRFCV